MLYKKYHRDFVKQFKKGAKFRHTFSNGTEAIVEVIKELPIIELTFYGHLPYIATKYVNGSKKVILPLVFWNGQLVKRYVIQEIS